MEATEVKKKLTPEERREIEDRIKALDMQQYAIKIIINSLYGAFGNKHFYFYDPDIAQSITVQGQDLIKFSIKAVNHYVMNKWHVDTQLHVKLGLGDCEIRKVDKEVAIYADTDSTYVNFLPVILSINGRTFTTDEAVHLIKAIIDESIAPFLDSAFVKYAEVHNTSNQMDFKLENISSSGIWVAKKHYVTRVAMEDGFYMHESKLMAKGIELAQPSFPAYARTKQREIVEVLLTKGYSVLHETDIIPRLIEMRKAFELMDREDVCYNYNVSVYDKYVMDDTSLVIPKGMPIRTRAALYHNHMIEQTGNLKYQKIREGNKVKFYYAKHPQNAEMNVFAFMPNNYPEFAFPMDYDEQFFSLVTDPINKLLEAMNMQSITSDFKRCVKYNMPKTKKVLTPDDIFPLYVIHSMTLEYVEFPNSVSQYFIKRDSDVPTDVSQEYVSYISKYGMNTEVVPKFELQKYIKKRKGLIAKAEARSKFKIMDENKKETFNEAVSILKTLKVKYGIDDETSAPTFTATKTKKSISLTMEQIEAFDSAEEIVGFVRGNILVEEKTDGD
jgi:hypothetical protein